jgi:hypothetical protein
MDTTSLILVGALAVLVVFYLMRRRARLTRDDD